MSSDLYLYQGVDTVSHVYSENNCDTLMIQLIT